jgi:hypothetical protein
MTDAPVTYPYIWRVKTRYPDRKGTRCRVIARGRMNTCYLEFETDKYRSFTSRNYIRKPKPGE